MFICVEHTFSPAFSCRFLPETRTHTFTRLVALTQQYHTPLYVCKIAFSLIWDPRFWFVFFYLRARSTLIIETKPFRPREESTKPVSKPSDFVTLPLTTSSSGDVDYHYIDRRESSQRCWWPGWSGTFYRQAEKRQKQIRLRGRHKFNLFRITNSNDWRSSGLSVRLWLIGNVCVKVFI